MVAKNDIKAQLIGYKQKKSNFETIKPGDQIRYIIDNELRSGGTVKINKYPKYIVLLNVVKKVSWCVQYNDPTLKIFVKTLETINKERIEKDRIYKMYKNGELVKKT